MMNKAVPNFFQSILYKNYILVFFVVFAIFIVPILPAGWHKLAYNILFTCIYFIAALSMDRHRKTILRLAVTVFIVEWVSIFLGLQYMYEISRIFTMLFFMLIVGNLIAMIARAKEISPKTIIEAINGYLLLSMVFGILVMLLMRSNPMSFNFPSLADGTAVNQFDFSDPIYYSLVTTTTLGYGDIVPKTPIAKSLATFMGVAGQFYIAIIIAMLVGKYASQRGK